MSKEATELAMEFGKSMSELRTVLRQYMCMKIKEHNFDITFELLEVMVQLWRKDGINQQELAAFAVKDKSSITYLVDSLVRRKLVLRVADNSDRRNKLIFLTEEGRSLEDQLRHVWLEMYIKATLKVRPEDLENAISMVKRMNENLISAN